MVGTKRKTSFKKNSIKNFRFDGDKIIKKEIESPKELRAVIYCRVSSEKQAKEGFGLETQEQYAREYCNKHNIIVDKVFIEPGISGKEIHRKAFDECVEYIKQKNNKFITITHFVCRDLSRISRPELDDIGAAFKMENRIKEYGVEIVDIEGNTKDETDEDKLSKTLQYAFAGYQRKKIQRTCMTGKLGRLLQGYWPFTNVPYGYVRKKVGGKENYIDEIDWDKACIIKEGLELFASDPNMSKSQLYKFMVSKGLKIRKTYIEKMFQIHRIYFYAGYCIYPEWDVCTLIEGRHEGIISLETANKLKNKLQREAPKIRRERTDTRFVLKHLITCKGCGRRFTGRITKKSNGSEYFYYGCQKEGCPERIVISKEKLEQQVYDMIKSCELTLPLKKLFDATLENIRGEKEQDWHKIKIAKQHRILQIKEKKKSVEDSILNSKLSERLKERFNEEWDELDTEEQMIKEELENEDVMKINRNKSLKKIKELIQSPLSFRDQGDDGLKTQLAEVRFGECLYYSKSNGLQTNEDLVLYKVLKDLTTKNTRSYQGWDSNPHDREVTRFGV